MSEIGNNVIMSENSQPLSLSLSLINIYIFSIIIKLL
jgi:hypothetical protein